MFYRIKEDIGVPCPGIGFRRKLREKSEGYSCTVYEIVFNLFKNRIVSYRLVKEVGNETYK